MTVYLTLEEALHIHATIAARYGSSPEIGDPGLLESALLRPQTGHYADLIEEAAALFESLVLVGGPGEANLRFTLAATEIFLELNELVLGADTEDVLLFIDHRRFDKPAIETWLLGVVTAA